MDGREGMASYYLQRGIGGTGLAHSPPGFRPSANPALPVQSNFGANSAGSTFPVESPVAAAASNVGAPTGVSPSGESVKRKRGRPRKYGPDGSMSSTLSTRTPVSAPAASSSSFMPMQKRGRGRPPGSGTKQQLASLDGDVTEIPIPWGCQQQSPPLCYRKSGEMLLGSAGMGFTPHVITISVGEDVASKIMSFSQQGPRAVCILSANGSVSTATLRQPASSGGIVTYEGRFEILCLSGSFLLTNNNGSRSRTGGLSISLASPDGRVVGGGVGGMLIAATPVQVIAGSFTYGSTKLKNKTATGPETSLEYDNPTSDDNLVTPTSGAPGHSFSPSTAMGGWPSSRSTDLRNTNIGLDLTHR